MYSHNNPHLAFNHLLKNLSEFFVPICVFLRMLRTILCHQWENAGIPYLCFGIPDGVVFCSSRSSWCPIKLLLVVKVCPATFFPVVCILGESETVIYSLNKSFWKTHDVSIATLWAEWAGWKTQSLTSRSSQSFWRNLSRILTQLSKSSS